MRGADLASSGGIFLAVIAQVVAFPTSLPMNNAAGPGMTYPVMGLGTAGGSKDIGFGQYPEVCVQTLRSVASSE